VRIRPGRANGAAQTGFRRQVNYVIKGRLEPFAQGRRVRGSSTASRRRAYIRGGENFPDFMDVWSQHFGTIPCALTVVPAKDYASNEGMIEINLIALKNGATRQESRSSRSIFRRWRRWARASAPASWCFRPPCCRSEATAWFRLRHRWRHSTVSRSQARCRGALLMSYAEAVLQGGRRHDAQTWWRAQYFLTDMREFAGVSAAWSSRYGKQPPPRSPAYRCPPPLPPSGAVVAGDFWIYAE